MKHKFIFGGIDSSDHNVWISGEGTFDSPERDVKRVAVPGRNGDLIIDNGRWKNIELEYPAFTPAGFDSSFPDFRSTICLKRGYQKLEDDYNPDEYRMAEFSEAIEPKPNAYNKSASYKLIFNCKPQRFLKSGDVPMQFLPAVVFGATFSTRLIPVGGDDVEFTVHCAEGETLTVKVYTYDSSGTQLTVNTFSCSDGDTQTQSFAASDKYFMVDVSGMDEIDDTWLNIKADTVISGETIALDATLARTARFTNPTGYAAKPLIEVYADSLPNMVISNYIGDERYEFFDFRSTGTLSSHLFLDCEMQYLYDSDGNNQTNHLVLTDMHSDIGEGLVFPELGTDVIELYMYYATATLSDGCGLVNIYPRWWKL